MDDYILKSEKINLKKHFLIAWGCIVVILVTSLVFIAIKYQPIREAQNLVIAATYEYTDYLNLYDENESSRRQLLEDMHYYYRQPDWDMPYDRALEAALNAQLDVREAADEAIALLLREKGFKSIYASDYLRFGTMTQYFIGQYPIVFYTNIVIILLTAMAHLLYLHNKKAELYVRNDVVIWKKASGKTVQFFPKDIKSVESTKKQSLKITGAGIKCSIHYVRNVTELKNTIMEMLVDLSKTQPLSPMPLNEASSIKEYKELMDSGIITQEEFDAKKKQLLGL